MFELLGMVLDFLDALAAAVTIACWWSTWVSPKRQTPLAPHDSGRNGFVEIDRFLLEVRACARSRSLAASCREDAATGAQVMH